MFAIHRTSRKLGLVGGAAAVALALAACTGGGSSSPSGSGATSATGSPTSGGTVTFAESPTAVPNWIFPLAGPAYFSTYNISNLQQLMYRPLYWFGGHNLQPTVDYGLSAAEPPQYASDGKSVTIKLKPWKWSNGEDVNADDVVFWMNMVKAEKANWGGYTPGAFPDNVTKVTKVDDRTVKLTLDAKYSEDWYTYNELSQITPMPMAWDVTSAGAAAGSGGCTSDIAKCKAVYDFLAGQAKDQKTYATSKIWGVVNGPWRLKTYSSSGSYSVVPNPDYSGSPKPRLDEVKFLPFTSDAAEFNVLKAGGTVDIGYIPKQDLPPKPAGAVLPSTNPVGADYYLAANYAWAVDYFPINFNNPTMGPVFKQLYVRQALAYTMNQPLIVEKAQQGYADAQYGPVPVRPQSKWLSPAAQQGSPYPFSTDKAKSLLESHGWTEQDGVMVCTDAGTASSQCGSGIAQGTKLSINLDYSSGEQALDQAMQQYKSDSSKAGIQLNLKQKPFNTVTGESVPCTPSQASCSWQLANWGGGWLYAPDYLPTGESLFATGSVANYGSYSDPKMDQLTKITTQQGGTGPLYDYQDYTAQQVPVVFQASPYTIQAVSTQVGGIVWNPIRSLTPEYWYRTQ
ncbi:ABC transporter substrate-binding protein [Nocardioides panaciterrulae]|uniref:Peptide/nickel transport system substrate-binding protein n=1 Tax=Nocardioides panaciterrulae TaxID=661492 RepID=A0A7Y9E617_9ACTN|nr:ABC transporter substrate-binding protein [Nocardioides panaciterrulae]NYD41899.1 peptide/nickel transport system substrate-binding protein [Nocardioides panaciterrulae]